MKKDTLNSINTILQRDSKDTTYKFALLRALVEITNEADQHLQSSDAQSVEFPTGLILEKWVLYYYPIIEAGLPQKHGEDLGDSAAKGIAFRSQFKAVIDFYASRGGFDAFYRDYKTEGVPSAISVAFLELLSKLHSTITRYPMKHLGYSVHGTHYYITEFKKNRPRLTKKRCSVALDASFVLDYFGTFVLRREYFDVFRLLGGLITGRDAIIHQWAQWTSAAGRGAGLSVEKVIQVLMTEPNTERNVVAARRIYSDYLDSGGPMRCVWTGRLITRSDLEVDHAIPFSLWANNDLWNLLPAHKHTNSRKRDRVPSPELIRKREKSIRNYWRVLRGEYREQFDREARLSLLGLRFQLESERWEHQGVAALSSKCHYLIHERGFPFWGAG